MASRWARQAQTPRGATPTDPIHTQLKNAAADARNAAILKSLRGDGDDESLRAILAPILNEMGQQMVQQMRGGQAPKQDDVTEWLNQRLKQKILMKELDGDDNRHAPKDVMAFAEGAVNIQKAAADTAMSVAEKERQLRLEAEQNMGAAADYARQDEQQKANQTIAMMDKMQTMVLGMMKESHAKELEFKDYQAKSAFERLEKMTADAIDRLSRTHEETQKAQEATHQKELALREMQHELALLKMQSSLPTGTDPDYLWKLAQLEDHKERKQLERMHMHDEHEVKQATYKLIHDELPKRLDQWMQIVGKGKVAAGNPLAQMPPNPNTPGGPNG